MTKVDNIVWWGVVAGTVYYVGKMIFGKVRRSRKPRMDHCVLAYRDGRVRERWQLTKEAAEAVAEEAAKDYGAANVKVSKCDHRKQLGSTMDDEELERQIRVAREKIRLIQEYERKQGSNPDWLWYGKHGTKEEEEGLNKLLAERRRRQGIGRMPELRPTAASESPEGLQRAAQHARMLAEQIRREGDAERAAKLEYRADLLELKAKMSLSGYSYRPMGTTPCPKLKKRWLKAEKAAHGARTKKERRKYEATSTRAFDRAVSAGCAWAL